jgi:hypothetical protein
MSVVKSTRRLLSHCLEKAIVFKAISSQRLSIICLLVPQELEFLDLHIDYQFLEKISSNKPFPLPPGNYPERSELSLNVQQFTSLIILSFRQCLLEYYDMQPLKVRWRSGEICLLPRQSSSEGTQKEADSKPDFQGTKQHYIPGHSTLHNDRCKLSYTAYL